MWDVLGDALLWWFRAFLSLEWFLGSLNIISDITFNLLKIAVFLLILSSMILLALRVFKKEGLVIMPFETSGNEQGKYNGKLVSDLLTGELQRILKVHGHEFEGISVTAENLSIPMIVPKSETLDYSIAEMGTVGNGSTTLSIGSLIVAFKRLCPGSEPVPILTGSLGCFGSLIELAACLEGRKIQAWEVRHGPKAGEPALEECIPGLIRDLSFKIAFDLALADPNMRVSAKTWRGFMHFTEAWEAYYNYTQTGNERDLIGSKRRVACRVFCKISGPVSTPIHSSIIDKYFLPVSHSSLISMRMVTPSLRSASSFGKAPTTRLLLLSSLLIRSSPLVVLIFFQCSFGKALWFQMS